MECACPAKRLMFFDCTQRGKVVVSISRLVQHPAQSAESPHCWSTMRTVPGTVDIGQPTHDLFHFLLGECRPNHDGISTSSTRKHGNRLGQPGHDSFRLFPHCRLRSITAHCTVWVRQRDTQHHFNKTTDVPALFPYMPVPSVPVPPSTCSPDKSEHSAMTSSLPYCTALRPSCAPLCGSAVNDKRKRGGCVLS